MKITDLLSKESIELKVTLDSKDMAVDKLVSLHSNAGNLSDTDAYKAAILKRESEGTTAVGGGVAVPHAKSDAVAKPGLAAVTVPDGVDYDAPDGDAVKLFFMIAAPMDGNLHLEILSRLVTLLMDGEFVNALENASSADEFLEIIDAAESAKYPDEAKKAPESSAAFQVLAVTACPTGIAHTYMAAEALEKKAKEMGITLKAETDGSGGAKNVLTDKEIAEADGIIVAADREVAMARFDGKPVIKTKVADGIHKPEELINKVLNKEAPVYHHTGGADAGADAGSDEGAGRKVYKQLMNGVSHMLPFVVAGGIFIALAFLIDTLTGHASDKSGAFGTINPIAAWFKNVGKLAFDLMVPILAGYIAYAIADRPGLLVGMVGGLLASSGATFADPGAASTIPSGFLGALLAGFAGGYLMLAVEKLCEKMPRSLEGIKPVLIYPLCGLGMVAVMMCAVNPIMGAINTGLNNGLKYLGNRPQYAVLLGLILGGMMAIDMGGPFNKAAYVFGSVVGLGMKNETGYAMMAAVMIGGMVPPIAIALSTTIFKNLWSEDERKNGPVNYIMGLSFITEGAIPYAAADPLRVIPSCVVGSAVAGAISMFFKCTLMAPHGGIFVFAVVGKWYFYILALVVGSVVACAMLTFLKKIAKK